jgi:DNA-binding winged helix-turn-helix (wHTH) protein
VRFEFDPFVLEDGERRLLKQGIEVHLSPKAFVLLKVLLQRRPRAVSKEELHHELWPGTHVSEATLTALVSEVRMALGERGQRHGRVRTVHGFGYAFDGTATTVGDSPGRRQPEPTTGAPAVHAADSRREPSAAATTRRPTATGLSVAIVLVMAAVSATFYVAGHGQSARAQRRLAHVIITDIETALQSAALNRALKESVAAALERTGLLAVVDERGQEGTLADMGLFRGTPVTRRLARQLCGPMNARAIVAGTLDLAGHAYVLGLEAEACGTGAVIAREQREVVPQEEIASVVGQMAESLRESLEERLPSLR